MGKSRIVSCQLSYLPINSNQYLADIDVILKAIKVAFPDAKVGEMSTYIIGSKEKVYQLIKKLLDLSIQKEQPFHFTFSVSNLCGC